jgi:hypothetical protein
MTDKLEQLLGMSDLRTDFLKFEIELNKLQNKARSDYFEVGRACLMGAYGLSSSQFTYLFYGVQLQERVKK